MAPVEHHAVEHHASDSGCQACLEFKREAGPDIYEALADYQTSEQWPAKTLITELHRWAAIFNKEFELGVPEFVLGIDRLRLTRLGHFRGGHNGFALMGEIIINNRYIGEREGWQTLGTLLHELLHGWQQAHGKPGKRNYHNQEFRKKAARFGLIVDERGYTQYEPDSPFTRLLREHGVDVAPLKLPIELPRRHAGESKLRKWSCGCTNVRVAVRSFRAQCLNCGRDFQPSGW